MNPLLADPAGAHCAAPCPKLNLAFFLRFSSAVAELVEVVRLHLALPSLPAAASELQPQFQSRRSPNHSLELWGMMLVRFTRKA